jgi:hypothetical protein
MNCLKAHQQMDACAAHGTAPGAALAAHFADCDGCRDRFADARLVAALRAESVPEPSPGFVDAAIRQATQVRFVPAHRVGAIAAVVAVIGIAVGVLVGVQWQRAPGMAAALVQVELPLNQSAMVRLLIESPTDQDVATVSIELANNIELAGFANQHHVEWQTRLVAGKNLLALPLQLTTASDSHFDVAVAYGATRKAIRVAVRPKQQDVPQERA